MFKTNWHFENFVWLYSFALICVMYSRVLRCQEKFVRILFDFFGFWNRIPGLCAVIILCGHCLSQKVPISIVFKMMFLSPGRIAGRRVLQSGCLPPGRPRKGKIQCTRNRVRCRVVCKKGFVATGASVKRKCSILTGRWNPRKLPRCIRKPRGTVRNAKPPIIIAGNRISLRQSLVSRLWSPGRNRAISSGARNTEEEEEEEEEESRLSPTLLPKKIIPTKPQSKPFITTASIFSGRKGEAALHDTTTSPSSVERHLSKGSPTATSAVPGRDNKPKDESSFRKNGDEWTSDGLLYKPLMSANKTIYGCPTYNGTITINSKWRGGFSGLAYFAHLPNDILGGWLVRIIFDTPVASLETYTVKFYAAAKSGKEYCLAPKPYTVDLYANQVKARYERFECIKKAKWLWSIVCFLTTFAWMQWITEW